MHSHLHHSPMHLHHLQHLVHLPVQPTSDNPLRHNQPSHNAYGYLVDSPYSHDVGSIQHHVEEHADYHGLLIRCSLHRHNTHTHSLCYISRQLQNITLPLTILGHQPPHNLLSIQAHRHYPYAHQTHHTVHRQIKMHNSHSIGFAVLGIHHRLPRPIRT